jgi:plastocyanin domain-containing protein
MEKEKMFFAAAILLALAFFGFILFQGMTPSTAPADISSHDIDLNAKPTIEQSGQPSTAQNNQPAQEVSLNAGPNGYDKAEIRVKAGVPVHFTFTANNAGCCAQLLIDKVGVQLISRGQAVDATFTPSAPGNYPYHCGMNMCRGVLVAE